MELVHRFPLRPIRNDADHKRAEALVGELMAHDDAGALDAGASDYLDTLILLVNKYEDEHHSISHEMTPQQALRALMGRQPDEADRHLPHHRQRERRVHVPERDARPVKEPHLKLAARFKVDPTIFTDAVIGR